MNKEYKLFDRVQENNFSYWFPKIENCGIKVPKSIVIPVPNEIIQSFYLENYEKDERTIDNFVAQYVEPKIEEAGLKEHRLFIKNGTFSNKFNAGISCLPSYAQSLSQAIMVINYEALCLDAGGHSEIVIRERISYSQEKTACIYNGLPFRPEFRVFYDFDEHEVIFSVNYWDYDYIRRNPYDRLYTKTDKIIFEHEIKEITAIFEDRKIEVEQLVHTAMKSVDTLENAWSIDLLLDEQGTFWLIDMAVAERSAYWEWRNGKVVKTLDNEKDTNISDIIKVERV